jgi:hypothetical protein
MDIVPGWRVAVMKGLFLWRNRRKSEPRNSEPQLLTAEDAEVRRGSQRFAEDNATAVS